MKRSVLPVGPPANFVRLPCVVLPFSYAASEFDDASLSIGETVWIGPIPEDYRWPSFLSLPGRIRQLGKEGVHLMRGYKGPFFFTRRLSAGPVRKLTDWEELSVGSALMLHPRPCAEAVEQAKNRSAYLRHRNRGHFCPYIDTDGSLWIVRAG